MDNSFDPTSFSDWFNFIVGFLTVDEWKAVGITLLATYAFAYFFNIVYRSTVNKPFQNPNHVRLVVLFSGLLSSFWQWPGEWKSLDWVVNGFVISLIAIGLYHSLRGIALSDFGRNKIPWLYPLIKGKRDRRKFQQPIASGSNRRGV